MKKMIWTIYALICVGFVIMLTNYIANEKWIENYEDGEYSVNTMSFLGFSQPCIAPYNKGNMYYMQNEYELAINEYDKALEKHPSKKQECDIRINKTLAMIAHIDIEQVKDEEIDDTIKLLEDAKELLSEKDCANEDGSGHNKKAQKLYDEIEEMIKKLKKQKEQADKDDENDDSQDSSDSDDEDKNEEEKDKQSAQEKESVKEQLQDLQEQGTSEHDNNLSQYDEMFSYDYYDGKSW